MWFDAIFWRPIEHARKASEHFPKSDVGQQLCPRTDDASATMRQMEVIAESMGQCDSVAD
mgnify:CR=1 FL=1